jgi:hypothetical protein
MDVLSDHAAKAKKGKELPKLAFPVIRFHDLRHSAATVLLAQVEPAVDHGVARKFSGALHDADLRARAPRGSVFACYQNARNSESNARCYEDCF